MAVSVIPLTALSEAQRAQALSRFAIIRPALEDGVTQAQVARTHQLSTSTVQSWIKRYRDKGLSGLANNVERSDKGKPRRLPPEAILLIEGLALQTPPRSAASIHRQVSTIAKEQGWPTPSYNRVYTIIKQLDPALLTMAHQGAAAYREEFDLLYRRESPHSNAMWQADHTPLDVLLLDEAGKPTNAFSYLVEAANERHQGKEDFLVTRRTSAYIDLLIIDEANRLKGAGLEQIRDLYDKGRFGLVLLGMPGLDKRLQRAPQLYSRVGFAHKMEPLSEEETRFFLDQRWSHHVNAHSDDFTDQEAVATIVRITRGNIRLIDRLMMQVELVLAANGLTVVTKEVVETARKNLIIGFE